MGISPAGDEKQLVAFADVTSTNRPEYVTSSGKEHRNGADVNGEKPVRTVVDTDDGKEATWLPLAIGTLPSVSATPATKKPH